VPGYGGLNRQKKSGHYLPWLRAIGYIKSMSKNLPLAQRIKELRRACDFTQQDLSRASGLSRSYISRLEMGDISLPSRDKLRALASALDTTIDDLLQAAGFLETPTDAASLPDLRTYLSRKYGIHDIRAYQAIETVIEGLRLLGSASKAGVGEPLKADSQPPQNLPMHGVQDTSDGQDRVWQ
jgi:transcriptional regulator with XRE-family HTH domain